MIDFEGCYLISAGQIEYIDTYNEENTGWYGLNVHLLGGRVLTVKYRTKMGRDDGRKRMYQKVEDERRRDAENIENRLYLIEQAIKGVDKRQYKIWKQLKSLLRLGQDNEI